MKKKTPYLDFYNKCLEDGKMPENGLCNCFGAPCDIFTTNLQPQYEDFRLFIPTKEDRSIYTGGNYWAGPDPWRFTELRQTIVLFLAAMNNEL